MTMGDWAIRVVMGPLRRPLAAMGAGIATVLVLAGLATASAAVAAVPPTPSQRAQIIAAANRSTSPLMRRERLVTDIRVTANGRWAAAKLVAKPRYRRVFATATEVFRHSRAGWRYVSYGVLGVDCSALSRATIQDLGLICLPQTGPPGNPPGGGGGAPGPPKKRADCRGRGAVTVDVVEALSGCFVRRGGAWYSSTRVRANGIDLTPQGSGSQIVIDPTGGMLSSTGPVRASVGAIRLARIEALHWAVGHPIGFSVQSSGEKGLHLKGSAELEFRPGVSRLTVGVELPKFLAPEHVEALTASGTLQASNYGGLKGGGEVKADAIELGRVEVRDVSLKLEPTDSGALHLNGNGTLYLVPSKPFAIKIGLGFGSDGYFRAAGGVDGINKPIADTGFFFQRVNLSVELHPFELGGGAGASFGPQIKLPGKGPEEAASFDGAFSYATGPPWSFTLSGDANIAEAKLAHAHVTIMPGEVDAAGNAQFEWHNYGLDGNVSGWATHRAIDAQGSVTLTLPGDIDLQGDAVVSSVGIAACRHGAGPDTGFGYRWGRHLSIMARSCGIGPWEASKAHARAGQVGNEVQLPGGLRTAAVAITGATAAPKVTLTGPDGTTVATPADASGIDSNRFVLIQDQAQRTTYIAVAHPAAGAWRITPQAGSAPITGVRWAHALPTVHVSARVSGHGRRRSVSWRAHGLRGRRLRLVEAGKGVHHVLTTTARASGTQSFTPVPGPAGRREITAVVLQGGLAQDSQTAGHYRAPALPRAAAPRDVRLHRHGLSATLTWRGPAHGSYRVLVRLSDGRRLLLLPRHPRAEIRPLLRSTHVHATVQRYDVLGRLGHAGHLRARTRHRRPPFVGLG